MSARARVGEYDTLINHCAVHSVDFSCGNGGLLASSGADGTVRLWDVPAGGAAGSGAGDGVGGAVKAEGAASSSAKMRAEQVLLSSAFFLSFFGVYGVSRDVSGVEVGVWFGVVVFLATLDIWKRERLMRGCTLCTWVRNAREQAHARPETLCLHTRGSMPMMRVRFSRTNLLLAAGAHSPASKE